MNPRLRIAPSPTGNLHIGTARLALFNFLYTKKHNGTLVLRIEDTDTVRSTKAFEQNIIESLEWLGITYDEFYRQSERKEIYKSYIEKLLAEGKAYVSKEEVKEEGDRAEVIRFKNPNKVVVFNDLIRGEVKMDTTDLGDFVIAKSVDEPIFHLAVVVDDHEMNITHIMRGDDHLSNTPRHILIQEAIGAQQPIYIHLPMVLSPDKSKMSKRHGAVSVTEYREKGYLKEAIINFLAFLGWNPGTEQELFSLSELIEAFDVEGISKSAGVFNIEKLNWFNREYILKLPKKILIEEIEKRLGIADDSLAEKIQPIVLDHIMLLSDIDAMKVSGEFSFFTEVPAYTKEMLYWKDIKDDKITAEHLAKAKELLLPLDDSNWNQETVKAALWDYASLVGRGNVLWPFRISLTGKQKSPDPFIVAAILGKKESVLRIDNALHLLNAQ